MKNGKNNELNKNGTLFSISKRQVKNKCDNIGREETMTKYIDIPYFSLSLSPRVIVAPKSILKFLR